MQAATAPVKKVATPPIAFKKQILHAAGWWLIQKKKITGENVNDSFVSDYKHSMFA